MISKETVIAVALAEEGYLEKASNSNLDDKTANAGSANYTKYARDLDQITGFYNGRKNGHPWCDCFVDHCFVTAYGVETAKKLLCQPNKSLGAGCQYSAKYYAQHGQLYKSDPQPGDQIFFGSPPYHTGLVYKVDNSRVYTIEGNTSGASGVVDNGGGVFRKSYRLTDKAIYGYGRPAYDDTKKAAEDAPNAVETPEIDGLIDSIKDVQIWLNRDYHAGLTIDGLYGSRTKAALVRVLQAALSVEVDGIYGRETNAAVRLLRYGSKGSDVRALQGLLVCNGYKSAYVDGDFGNGTKSAVLAYQEKHGLEVDGIAGQETFTSLCK